MIQKVFTIYDSKLEAYMQPFFMQSKGQAIRAFTDSVNDSQSQFNKHPEDFTLFQIGEYDDATARIQNLSTPQSLGVALEYLKEKKSL